MTTQPQDPIAALRHWLSEVNATPTQQQWQILHDLLSQCSQEDKELILSYATQHMAQWPEDKRNAYIFDLSKEYWPLLRSLQLSQEDFHSLSNAQLAQCHRLHRLSITGTSAAWGPTAEEIATQLQHFPALQQLRLGHYPGTDLQPLPAYPQLTSLMIDNSPELQSTKGLERYPRLETLQINNAKQLSELSECNQLPQLTSLALQGFADSQTLTLTATPKLNRLTLSDCPSIEALDFLANVPQLQHFSLQTGSWQVKAPIPPLAPLSTLTALETLELTLYEEDRALTHLTKNTRLKRLCISRCGKLEGLALKEHPTLETLVLFGKGSNDLTQLPMLPQLQNLTLDLYELQSLAGMPCYPHLTSLEIEDNAEGFSLAALPKCPNLASLSLEGSLYLESLDGLSDLPALHSIQFGEIEGFTSLEGMAALPSLTHLALSNWSELDDLSALTELPNVNELWLQLNDENILETIPDGTKIDTIEICGQVKELHLPHTLSLLSTLKLSHCFALDSISCDDELDGLMFVNIENCPELESIDFLRHHTKMRRLELNNCDGLCSLEGLAEATELRDLEILNCEALESLDGLPQSNHLTSLHMAGVGELNDIKALAHISQLQRLTIESNPVESFDVLSQLPLTHLSLHSYALASFGWLTTLTSLETLELIHTGTHPFSFAQLPAAPGMHRCKIHGTNAHKEGEMPSSLQGCPPLPSLTSLSLMQTPTISSLHGIEAMPNLTELMIRHSEGPIDLQSLPKLPNLSTLILHRALQTQHIDAIVQCNQLRRLYLGACPTPSMLAPLIALPLLSELSFELPFPRENEHPEGNDNPFVWKQQQYRDRRSIKAFLQP